MGVITTTSNEEISKLKSQLEILTSLGATTRALFWQNVVQNGNGHTWDGKEIYPNVWNLIKDVKRP